MIDLEKAIELHKEGLFDEAEVMYRKILDKDSTNARAWYYLGMLAWQHNALNLASDALLKATKYDETVSDYWCGLGLVSEDLGYLSEALDYFRKAININPENLDIKINIANALRLQDKREEALSLYTEVLEHDNDNIIAINNIGLIYADEMDFAKSIEYFKKALKIDPYYEIARYNLACSLRGQNNFLMAITEYTTLIDKNKEVAEYFNGRGLAFAGINNHLEAIEDYKKALEIKKDNPDFLFNYASSLFKTGEIWPAHDILKKVIEINPKNAKAHANFGVVQYKLELYQGALESYRAAIELDPKNVEVMNNLAIILKETGEIEDAVGLYLSAIYHAPDSVSISVNAALALAELYTRDDDGREKASKLIKTWQNEHKNNVILKYLALATINPEPVDNFSNEYIDTAFNKYTKDFDEIGETDTNTLLEFSRLFTVEERDLSILDAGCGIGRLGRILMSEAKRLVGVDVSNEMILKTKKIEKYDAVFNMEICDFLDKTNESFDMIVMADLLWYFGDLTPILTKSYNSLNDNGKILFSFFTNHIDNNNYKLTPKLEFVHNFDYVKEVLEKIGYKIDTAYETISKKENEIRGYIVKAVKQPL